MTVVHIMKDKFDVRIDRKTKWGNPFPMRNESDRDMVIEQYRLWLWKEIQDGKIDLAELAKLKDKKLGCWCAPRACHGDVLTKAATWADYQLKK